MSYNTHIKNDPWIPASKVFLIYSIIILIITLLVYVFSEDSQNLYKLLSINVIGVFFLFLASIFLLKKDFMGVYLGSLVLIFLIVATVVYDYQFNYSFNTSNIYNQFNLFDILKDIFGAVAFYSFGIFHLFRILLLRGTN